MAFNNFIRNRNGNTPGPMHNNTTKNNRVNPIRKMTLYSPTQNNPVNFMPYNSQQNNMAVSVGINEYSLYVYNLAPETNEEDLWKMFSPFGAIKKIVLMKDPTSGASRGFAFVDMKNLDDANLAIEILNGQELNKKTMRVNFKGQKSDNHNLGEVGAYQLYVYNIPNEINETGLFKLFGQFGGVKSVAIMKDFRKGQKPIAFVTMRKKEDAILTIKTLNGFCLENCVLQVRFKNQKGETENSSELVTNTEVQLYINNLDPFIEDQVVWKLFAQFGAIKDVNIMRDSNEKCVGYGFVTMKDMNTAMLAVNTLNGTNLSGRHINVSFKIKKERE